jgi:hypothetical protein
MVTRRSVRIRRAITIRRVDLSKPRGEPAIGEASVTSLLSASGSGGRIAVLPSTPGPRVDLEPLLCCDVATPSSPRGSPRFLYVEMNRQAPAQLNGQAPAFRNARRADIVVIDVVTGRVIAPADTSK